MRVTVATEEGETYAVDVAPEMELENVLALLEADTGIPVDEQLLFASGKQMTGTKDTLASYDVKEDDVILLRRRQPGPSTSTSIAGRDLSTESEAMRRQVLGNPQLMSQLRQANPELAAAAEDPTKFRDALVNFNAMQQSARLQQQREMELLNADPYNIEAQRKIEEAIRQEAVLENMESAMENMPESFGSVHMLYVNTEVNGKAVKAFVDSGAQATIMSPQCAERCGIMRLLDTRFAGMARGVGTAKILGRVHSAQIKMGSDLYLQCSFTIMEGKDVDLLFGLDMLKRHQATIDLARDALIIQGRELPFLPEHEVPKAGHEEEYELDGQGNPVPPMQSSSSASGQSATTSRTGEASTNAPFPGSGNTLGAPPRTSLTGSTPSPSSAGPGGPSASASRHPEESISGLIQLGCQRNEAIKLLDATNGNVEMAASLLFSSQF